MAKKWLELCSTNPLYVLIFFGIFIRLFVVAFYQHISIFPDSEGYIDLAERLAVDQLEGYNGQRSPGYPLLLISNSLLLTVGLQCVIGISTTLMVYKSLILLQFKSNVALWICLFLSSFIHVVFYDLAILTESLTLFIINCIFYFFTKTYNKQNTIKTTVYLSFLLGLLVLIKPFYIFLPFVLYAFFVFQKGKIKYVINRYILILVFPLISFFGWSYINKINTGYFVPTTFYGINIAQNCVYFAEKAPEKFHVIRDIYVKHRDLAIRNNEDVSMSIWHAYDELVSETGLSFVDLSHQLNEFSRETIILNPIDYTQQVLRSWSDFWKTAIYWNYDAFAFPFVNKFFLIIWYAQSLILSLFKIAFVLLIPIQIYRNIRNGKISIDLIWSIVILTTSILQALVTYGTNSRFSYPFEMIMIIIVLHNFYLLKKQK